MSCKTPLYLMDVQVNENINITSQYSEDPKMVTTILPYKSVMEEKMNTKLSYTPVELTKLGVNSNLGALLADFTYEGAREWSNKNGKKPVDAAVINIGGIRSNMNQGDILLKHVFEVMPFENEIVIVKMDARAVQELFDYYKGKKSNPVSRLFIETDGDTILKALINGQVLDENKTYYIATSDYLALGGDNMRFFKKGEMIQTGIKLRDLFVEKFKQKPQVVAPTDIRLIFH